MARSPVLRFLRRHLPRFVLVLLGMFLLWAGLILLLVALYRAPGIQPYSTLMLADMVQSEPFERKWLSFDDMGQALPQSVIMSEDGQFCSHRGVDFNELRAVIDQALEGEEVRGASTITMQVAKNLFLWGGRSYLRKALELPIALVIDLAWPKKRIMEVYLNIAEWGDGIYGAGAASRHYFKRSPDKLSRRQAALLTVALPNPYVRNPAKPSAGLARLARLIERRAKASGAYIGCLKE